MSFPGFDVRSVSGRPTNGVTPLDTPRQQQNSSNVELRRPVSITSRSTLSLKRLRPQNLCKSAALYGSGQGSGNGGSGDGGFGGGGGDPGDSFPRNSSAIFAVLVAVGGYMGYRKKGSKASLKASGGVATALLVAAALMGGPYHTVGLALALAANLALGGYMAKGYANTRKLFPQAVFALLSGLNSLLFVKKLTRSF